VHNALAELLTTVGTACLRCAEELRALEDATPIRTTSDDVVDLNLGSRQQEIAELLRAVGEEGYRTSDVAREIDYNQANTHMTLRALQTRGVVEEIPGEQPTKWRLAPRYRPTADPYLRIASLVGPGEWTTYGDVSIAVRGDNRGARAVGRAAAKLDHFPNPHRVINAGGLIPPGWHHTDNDEPNPDECRRRLKAEGVKFDRESGRALREFYVPWDELVSRADGLSSTS